MWDVIKRTIKLPMHFCTKQDFRLENLKVMCCVYILSDHLVLVRSCFC